MVAKKLAKYLNIKDTNDDTIGSWAVECTDSKARCKACLGTEIDFSKGKNAFMLHSQTKKHCDNIGKQRKQKSISGFFVIKEEQDLKRRVRNFEIDLTRRLDSHNVPTTVIDCLVDRIKTHLSGNYSSKIVNEMKLGKTKAEYLAKRGIAKTLLKVTINKLQECDAFSIGFDESEINKNHECEIMVMISMKETGIEMRHYRTITLYGTDAAMITKNVTDQLDDDRIPWRQKLISPMTDGCNTMSGHVSGVKKRIKWGE